MVEAVRNMANIPSPFAAFDEPMPPVTLGVASSGPGPEAHPGRGAARADSGCVSVNLWLRLFAFSKSA